MPALAAERRWFAPERAVPGLRDLTGPLNAVWGTMLAAEVLASLVWKKKRVYGLRQCINNLASWLLTTLYIALVKALLIWPYAWLHDRCALVALTPASAPWIHLAAFVYVDFVFYWGHRAAHGANLMWAAHVMHHSSPDYNYSTGFRASFLEHTVIPLPFMAYHPLALVCPPHPYFFYKQLNQVLQFWVHTELVGKLWWPVELVLVTPSHHRVHHARNYGRKNFSGLFIVWDRLFGTFQEERADRKPLYGLNAQTVVQGTYNPLWHQVHHLLATFRLAASGKVSLYTALYTRTTGPGMIHPAATDQLEGNGRGQHAGKGGGGGRTGPARVQLVARAGQRAPEAADPWEPRPLGPLDYYAAAHFFLMALPAYAWLLAAIPDLTNAQVLAFSGFAAWTITSTAWLCGGEARVARLELSRLAVQGAAAAWLAYTAVPGSTTALLACGSVGATAASAAWLLAAFPGPEATEGSDETKAD